MTDPTSIGGVRKTDPLSRIVARLKAAEKAITQLRTARGSSYTTVGSGSLQIAGGIISVTDSAGNVVWTTGTDANGTGQRNYRANGSIMFESMGVNETFGGLTYTAIHDAVGNPVFNDDLAGVGLGRPFFPVGQMVDACAPGTFPASPTSATWVTMQTAFCSRWHPRVMWQGIVSSSDGTTTGNVQLVDAAGTVIGAPIPVPPGANTYLGFDTPKAWPAPWTPGDSQYISIQAQLTAGTGTIGVRTTGLLGWLAF